MTEETRRLAELCPSCRGPLDVAHDDPEWDAVCADCCIECRVWVPGGWFDVPGHGPGVVVSVDKMGVCRFLVRDSGSGPLTFDVRYPRGYRACPRPGWAVDLGVLLSGDRTLFGVS